MKKLMLLGAGLSLALSSLASSQAPLRTQVPTVRGVPVLLPLPRAALKNVFPPGYDAAQACATLKLDAYGDADFTWPARFPDAARRQLLLRDYRLNCPYFTVERFEDKTLTIFGLLPQNLEPLLERGSNGLPYLWSMGETRIDLSEPGVIRAITEDDEAPRQDYVIAVRQGAGPLQPVVFDGGVLEVEYDPALPLEIFRKASYTLQWERAVWDTKTRVLHFDAEHPFPKP